MTERSRPLACVAAFAAALALSACGSVQKSTPCTFSYGDWTPAICPPRGTQQRAASEGSPPGCSGEPALTQQCTRPANWVWFAPLDPTPRANFTGSPQFLSLFSPAASWPSAAARTSVFKLYAGALENLGDANLRAVFADLDRRGIELALEYGVLGDTDACGRGVEGFGGRALVSAARRIAALGGTLRYVAMDEPFYFGSLYDGANACRWSPQQVAADAAVSLRALKAEFPLVEVGDIEPLPIAGTDWLTRYTTMVDAFATAGFPLAFMHADVQWTDTDWRAGVDALRAVATARAVRFGVIYNGDSADLTDAQWIGKADQRMPAYELESGAPDVAVFQSWHPYPRTLLPDTDSDAFTWLINRYRRIRTALTGALQGSLAGGSLRTATGDALARASVVVSAQATSGLGLTGTYLVSGPIPAGTTTMAMGVRVNTQCNNCRGDADLLVESTRTDIGGSTVTRDFRDGFTSWTVSNPAVVSLEGTSARLIVPTAQRLLLTSAPFAAAGSAFTFTVVARVAPASRGSGHFVLIFGDANGEISRAEIPLEAAKVPLGTATTDSAGHWQVSLPLSGVDGARLWADYAGDVALWPARVVVR